MLFDRAAVKIRKKGRKNMKNMYMVIPDRDIAKTGAALVISPESAKIIFNDCDGHDVVWGKADLAEGECKKFITELIAYAVDEADEPRTLCDGIHIECSVDDGWYDIAVNRATVTVAGGHLTGSSLKHFLDQL